MKNLLLILADLIVVGACAAVLLRWLRVAQREHYLPGTVTPFLGRWIRARWWNVAGVVGAVGALLGALVFPVSLKGDACVLLLGGYAVLFPMGLSIKGRTSTLAWTDRLRRVGVVTVVLGGILVGLTAALGSATAGLGLCVLLCPLLVDAALWLLAAGEAARMQVFVDQAAATLAAVHPRVVAITGSFGKTSTKNHLAQILHGQRVTIATPASFNNRGGLARSINEHLQPGTEVFIAEMGTYGPGEIAELCAWIPPEISILTAIGPVHLERFGSLEVTLASKAEITTHAATTILNGDDVRLAGLAATLTDAGRHVVRCSAVDPSADVAVVAEGDEVVLHVGGVRYGQPTRLPAGVQATNVACAAAAALALGLDPEIVATQLARLAPTQNRLTTAVAPSGVHVLDDTFNANPTGAAAALAALAAQPVERRIVVTPGMIELGSSARDANATFAAQAGAVADVVILVGRTNRRSMKRGLAGTSATVMTVEHRDDAVAWVRANGTGRDAVLYENDLPDHYP